MSVTIKHEPPHFGPLMTAEGIRGGQVPYYVYRQEIDLTEIADEYAKRIQERVDGIALDKAAGTLAKYGYVKVVRCRDCERFDGEHEGCRRFSHYVEPDGFCAWGERKEVDA